MLTLEPFARDIWISSGPIIASLGFRYPTRMAVVRLADGGLLIWSPVEASLPLRVALDTLGPVRFLVAPNSLHHTFLSEWRTAYPNAELFAPPGLRERRKDITFDADLGDDPPEAWAGQVDQAPIRGNRITTEVVFFHRASRVVLIADLIQHFPKGWFKGWRGFIASLDGMTGREPRVPQKFRIAFSDRDAAREGVQRILAWPVEHVIMAHAEPVRGHARAFIARAFRWLC